MQNNLQEKVAELFTHFVGAVFLRGLEKLIRFVKKGRKKTFMCLLAVPRAPARRAQLRDVGAAEPVLQLEQPAHRQRGPRGRGVVVSGRGAAGRRRALGAHRQGDAAVSPVLLRDAQALDGLNVTPSASASRLHCAAGRRWPAPRAPRGSSPAPRRRPRGETTPPRAPSAP